MPSYTKLKGIDDVSESTLCDQLESNLIEFFNWGLLGIGAFFNVTTDLDESRLRAVEDPRTVRGKVWEPFRTNIIWESGVEYQLQPIGISGVYVDNAFYPTSGSGTYAHHIDYINGKVVFNTAIDYTKDVRLQYSYRYYNFTTADVPWFRQVMFDSFRVDNNNFFQFGSGVWSTLSQNRVQLPAVVVEATPRRSSEGYQLGGGRKVKQDILFHVFTENPWDRKTIMDIIGYQEDTTIKTFDKNVVAAQDKFTFEENGALSSTPLTYPQLIEACFWKNITINSISSQETISMPPLYQAVVRGTFEVILP